MKEKEENTILEEEKILLRIKKEEERKALQKSILETTEAKVVVKRSDENLDRLNEIIELQNGSKVTLRSLRLYVSENPKSYEVLFPREFYFQIWRLNGWEVTDPVFHHKPHSVADFTVQVIYGRFYKEILPELRNKNPYIAYCIRAYKLFQYLTDEAQAQLVSFINDAVIMMKTCQTMGQFREKYGKTYGLPFQYGLWD